MLHTFWQLIRRRPSLTMLRFRWIAMPLTAAIIALPHAAHAAGSDSLARATTPSPSVGDTLWRDVTESAEDAVLFYASPAHFDAQDWILTGGAVGGTMAAMAADDPVRSASMRWHSVGMDHLTDVGNTYGTPVPALIAAGGLYLGGLIFDAPGIRRAGRHIVQAGLYAGIITFTLKMLLGRHRPFLGDGPFTFHGPSAQDDFNSLPSGHSTMAFALSATLAAEIDNPWATTGLYALAALTALSRIYADRHWTSDVFLGAAIGTACGYGVVHLHDPGSSPSGWLLTPTLNGFAMVYRF